MLLVEREAWDAEYGRGGTNITPQYGGVTLHYEGGGLLTGRLHTVCAGKVRAIEEYHAEDNGWDGIAYTLLVCEHGYVYEGRGVGHRTAANGTTAGNQNWYAVCAMIGDRDPLSDALLRGMRDAIDYLRVHGAGSRLNGHRDHLPTSCPGTRLYEWMKAGAPRPGGGPAPVKPARLLQLRSPYMRGPDVKWAQGRLNVHPPRPRLVPDGRFGPATDRATRAFQRRCKLVPDGVIGRKTRAALTKDP